MLTESFCDSASEVANIDTYETAAARTPGKPTSGANEETGR